MAAPRGLRRGGLCWRARALAAGFVLLASGCQASSGRAAQGVPPGPPVVRVNMSEYRFTYSPRLGPGRTVFVFRDVGRTPHSVSLLPLPEDLPPIDQQLRGPNRRVVTPFAQVPFVTPGHSGAFAVDLVPGQRYAFVCFLSDPTDGVSHAVKGMSSEFRPSSAVGPARSTR